MEKIEYYINILKSLEKVYNSSNDLKNKLISKELYIYYLKKLIEIQDESLIYYREFLNSSNLTDKEKEKLLLEIKNKTNYIKVFDSLVIEENKKKIEKLKEDLKNPNETLLKTWLDNYYDFIIINKDKFEIDKLLNYLCNYFDNEFSSLFKNFKNKIEKMNPDMVYEIIETKFSNDNLKELNSTILELLLSKEESQNLSIEKFNSNIKSKLLRLSSRKNGKIDSNYKRNRYLSMILKEKNIDMNKKELGNY